MVFFFDHYSIRNFFFLTAKALKHEVKNGEFTPLKNPVVYASLSTSRGMRDQSGLVSRIRSPSTTLSGGVPPSHSSVRHACPCSRVHASASWAATASRETSGAPNRKQLRFGALLERSVP